VPAAGAQIAAFLLGIPGGNVGNNTSFAQSNRYFGGFIQDDFKVTSRLTLNIGLRYEYESPVAERYNRSVEGFAASATNPIAAQAAANYAANPIPEIPASAFHVVGGLTFAGVNGVPHALWTVDKKDFLPRFGLAYQINPKTVLRGGYGIFYDSVGVNLTAGLQYGFSQLTPMQASLNNGLTYVASTANPVPQGATPPPGASQGLATYLGQSIQFYPTQRRRPMMQRWSFGLQRELPGHWLLDTSYVGSRADHLPVVNSIDNTPAQYLSTLPVRDTATINYLTASFPNPFYGTNSIYTSTISRAQLLKPYPEFSNVSVEQPVGYSFYNALQVRAEKRFSQGFTFQLGYTYSKNMVATSYLNPTDPKPFYDIGADDYRNHLTLSGYWELPFGRGKRFGGNISRPLNLFAGGWQIGAMVLRQGGVPLAWGDIWTLFTGNPANIVLPKGQRTADEWFNVNAGFNRNSAQQLANDIRVSTTYISGIRADGLASWDFTAIKGFRVTEKFVVEYRAECIDCLDHPNFTTPNTTPTSSAFGTISSNATGDTSRYFRMELKLKF